MLKNPSQVAKSTQHYFLAFLLLCSSPLPTCCAHMNPFQDDLPEATASIPETRSNYTAPAAKIPKLLHLGLLHDHPCVAVEWTQLWTHVLICTWHDLSDMRKFISTDLVVLKKAWFFWIDDLGCWFFDGRFWRQSVYSIYSFVVLSKTKVDHVATHRGPIGFLATCGISVADGNLPTRDPSCGRAERVYFQPETWPVEPVAAGNLVNSQGI